MTRKNKNKSDKHYSVDYKRKRVGENTRFCPLIEGEKLDEILDKLEKSNKYERYSNDRYEPTLVFQNSKISIKVVTFYPGSNRVNFLELTAKDKKSLESIARRYNLPIQKNKLFWSYGNYRHIHH